MNRPIKISIVTATWNCAEVLPDCLNSINNQTYDNREHIVVDGGSIDGTLELINEKLNAIDLLISEPDSGIYDALNKGIRHSTGDVIGFLHADDLYYSTDTLAKISLAFNDPSICAVYGDLTYVSRENTSKIIRKWRSNSFEMEKLKRGWMPPHPTLYVRREWYEKIGGFDSNYRISADYLSILRLFSDSTFKSIYLPQILIKMRIGGVSNKSLVTILRKSKEDWLALRSNNFNIYDAFKAIVIKNFSKIIQFI